MIQDRVYGGIDNGKNGSIVFKKNGKIIEKYIMPTFNAVQKKKTRKEYDFVAMAKIFSDMKEKESDIFVILEENLVMPISGRLSIASTSQCFGFFRGVLTTLKIPFQTCKPKIWQKEVFVGMNRKDTKVASITYARNRYPNEDFRASERCTIMHDGLTDGVCMCDYAEKIN